MTAYDGKDAYRVAIKGQPDVVRLKQMKKQYFIYIISNKSKILYTGLTNNIVRRIYEHKNKLIEGFTKKYNITKLVWFEETDDIGSAVAREKQIKGWLRNKKICLIESMNPNWRDLSDDF